MVLQPVTCGVAGKHQWCGILNTLQYAADPFAIERFIEVQKAGNAYYGLADMEEARAYLAHSVLSERLYEATNAVLAHADRDVETVMKSVHETIILLIVLLPDRV